MSPSFWNAMVTPSGFAAGAMLVLRIWARTLERLGVWPALHTAAIALISTSAAAYVGTPNDPYGPNCATPETICLSSELLDCEMSGPKFDTYVPTILNWDGELVPSVPNRIVFLCCL